MKTKTLLKTTVLLLCLLPVAVNSSEEGANFKEYLDQANNYIKAYRHFEASDALKEATKLGGAKHPSLHMRLGILYYGLGLIPEAITEGERAVSLAPASKWYKYDLAKFYYVDKQFDKAEKQFSSLLKLDPGFTLGYYYLAELYFQKSEYDMAWLSLNRAVLLGHLGKHLSQKLTPFTSKPKENFDLTAKNNQLFRFIKLSTAEEARDVLKQIDQGKLFENLELELRKDKVDTADFGVMLSSELKTTISESLQNTKPYSSPVVIRTGPDYRIMQKIAPFDPEAWKKIVKRSGKSSAKQGPKATADTADTGTATSKTEPEKQTEKLEPSAAEHDETTKPQLSNQLAAFYALEGWKVAWESQDLNEYFLSYSDNFIPEGGKSLQQWQKKRKRSLTRPQFIRIRIEDPVVETLSDQQLLITFQQSYESNTYQDTVMKTLIMDKESDGWKITQEREIPK